MAGTFEESKHPRDHGKFASGDGGGDRGTSAKRIAAAGAKRAAERPPAEPELTPKDHARIEKAKSRGAEHAAYRRMVSGEAEGKSPEEHDKEHSEKAAADAHDEIKNEKAAIAAGHVDPLETPKLDALEEASAKVAEHAAEVRDGLQKATAEAESAVARADSLRHEDDVATIGGDRASGQDDRSAALTALAERAKVEDTQDEHEPHDVPQHLEVPEHPGDHPGELERDPEHDDDDHEEALADHQALVEEHEKDVAEHTRVISERTAAHAEAADEAQGKLESLHALQLKAIDDLKAQDAKYKDAYKAATREQGKYDAEALVKLDPDEAEEADVDRATKASESMVAHAENRWDDLEHPSSRTTAIAELRAAAAATASDIKELSKFSKRAPVIGKATKAAKPAKGKAADPDDEDDEE